MIPSMLSFIVPTKDERDTLAELFDRVEEAVAPLDREFEVIFVDDGSTDGSWQVIEALHAGNPVRVRAIRFRRNLGKAAALAAGFEAARGEVVFTLDADLQDDPKEIGRFLEKLGEGFDVVSGWKKVRHDPWHKVLPSRVFNRMLSALSNTHLHDHNCGFKCYRRAVVKEITLYGEMHRMVPTLAAMRGFKSAEIEVTHHPRRFGKSKYGLRRFLRGFFDMMTTYFLRNFGERPLHALGGMGLLALAAGSLLLAAGFALGPLSPTATRFTILGGCLAASFLPLAGIGFFAEMMVNMNAGNRPLPIREELPKPLGFGLEVAPGGQPGGPVRTRQTASV